MIRPFEDIEEFKAVTGFKLGDVITVRYVGKRLLDKKDLISTLNDKIETTGIFYGYKQVIRYGVPNWSINIGGCTLYLNCDTGFEVLTKEGKWLPLGVKTEPKDEVKYHFEENGVYSTESDKAVTILKRMTINGIDYVVICPKSDEDKLVLEKIFYDGDNEVIVCELDDDEPTSVYAKNLFDRVTDEDKEDEDDTVDFVFKVK